MRVAIIDGYKTKLPTQATSGSAGWDFYMPYLTEVFLKELKDKNKWLTTYEENGFWLQEHSSVLIPSGLKVKIPQDTALVGFEKSGLATKYGIRPTCKVIDSDYQGQVYIGLENTHSERYFIECGKKVGQYLLLPIVKTTMEEVPLDTLYTDVTDRGEGGFGSTQ